MQLVNLHALLKVFLKCLPKFKNNLKIVTWNANSIKSKLYEFQSFLRKDTKLKKN